MAENGDNKRVKVKLLHPTADQAAEPYLQQMRKVSRRGTDLDAAALGLLMLFLSDDIMQSVAKELEPYGISEKKLDVLLLFTARDAHPKRSDPPTPSSIADYMNVTRATATGLLDWLETRGLIGRKNHPTDRRSIQTEITPKGRELVASILPTFTSACASLASGLAERDRADLRRLLGKVWNQIKHVEPQ